MTLVLIALVIASIVITITVDTPIAPRWRKSSWATMVARTRSRRFFRPRLTGSAGWIGGAAPFDRDLQRSRADLLAAAGRSVPFPDAADVRATGTRKVEPRLDASQIRGNERCRQGEGVSDDGLRGASPSRRPRA
jgi:hypothetical protein